MKDIIIDIKKELRANMNGIASSHMRQTEDYRVNWGIELPRLDDIANDIAKYHSEQVKTIMNLWLNVWHNI